MSTVTKNSELLYLYDARLCNPNGDPDEENKPRMDYETGRNLVSDVRLKRYLRDYWLELNEGAWRQLGYNQLQDVWVRKLEDANSGLQTVVSAKDRIADLAKEFGVDKLAPLLREASKKTKNAEDAKKRIGALKNQLLQLLVDVRLFGATMPIGEEEGERGGESLTLTGPVQFSWGYSLNRAEILPSSGITSHFASGRREDERHGTMGKDWRIKYGVLAFYGTVSAWRAKHTQFSETDLKLLDHSLIKALPLLATTRSKLNQAPRLYLRVEYKDDQTFLGDLRAWISLEKTENRESIADIQLNFTGLVERLGQQKAKIEKLLFWMHPDFGSGSALRRALEQQGLAIQDLSI